MKTTYLNPFGQEAFMIIKNYGNITRISQTTEHINQIIQETPNQEYKQVNTIQELCKEKIRQYIQQQTHKKTRQFNYLYNEGLETEDIISTHTLLQATAITYGSTSNEAEIISNTITNQIKIKLNRAHDKTVIDTVLSEYIDINNTYLDDIMPFVGNGKLKLTQLLISNKKIILTYEDFMEEYEEYLKYKNAEKIYEVLCDKTKKDLLVPLTRQKTIEYMKTVEEQLKQVEAAPIIKQVGIDIKNTINTEKENAMQSMYSKNINFTNYDDDKPTPYIPEAFPPCIKKALQGINSGGRNYCINMILTPFLSYARLYPGVYARHIKEAKVTDMDPTLKITREEIIPLIHEAAQNCTPPLFKDQPEEKHNINSKMGFGENNISHENCGKTPWYTPTNCQNIKQQSNLCTPCGDCQKIGNPLSYYNRKRKLIIKNRRKEEDAAKRSNKG